MSDTLPWRLQRGRSLPLIQQVEAAECGLACVCMIACYHGHETSLAAARISNPTSLRGTNVQDLVSIAAFYGMSARVVRCEPNELARLRLPAIVHWDMKHFVVLKEVGPSTITIHDPASGKRVVSFAEASASFTGVAIELTPNADFVPQRERRRLRFSSLVRFDTDISRTIGQGIALSLFIELLVLAGPFFLQTVIDRVILGGDISLLTVLALAFALIAIFRAGSTLLRGLTLQYVTSALAFDMKARLFRRLTRLPVSFIQKRSVGDVQQRFAALDPIKTFLSSGALLATFDGILSIVTAVLMIAYAADLALIVLSATALYMTIRLLTVSIGRRYAGLAMRFKAKEQSKFLETLRGFATIKASGIEPSREMLYRNLAAETLSAENKLGSVTVSMQALNLGITGVADVFVVLLAAKAVIAGQMTVGVLTAFMAYKVLFSARVATFIEQIVTLRLLDVQLEFVSDLALAEEESNLDDASPKPSIDGKISLRRVRFRYAQRDLDVLTGASMEIKPGEFIAIAGASGAGKSTLLRLIAGLNEPSTGEILLDDIPVRKWGKRALRRQIGVVMQDDQLLSGSIADNIAVFDSDYRYEDVLDAARLACIDAEILALPMGFHSFVGDLGSSLSGGQKQRIILARALYRKPRVLILDEGTSHVDVATERKINESLKAMAITRIVAAHRPDTLKAADRVFMLAKGELRLMGSPCSGEGDNSIMPQRGDAARGAREKRRLGAEPVNATWARRQPTAIVDE